MIRQFDVVRNPDDSLRDRVPYLAVLQSHLLYGLETVIVGPLIPSHIVFADGASSLAILFN